MVLNLYMRNDWTPPPPTVDNAMLRKISLLVVTMEHKHPIAELQVFQQERIKVIQIFPNEGKFVALYEAQNITIKTSDC